MAAMEKRAGGEEEFLLSLLRPLVQAKVYKVMQSSVNAPYLNLSC